MDGCIDRASSCSFNSNPKVTSTWVLELDPTMTTGGVSTLGEVGGSEAALRRGTPTTAKLQDVNTIPKRSITIYLKGSIWGLFCCKAR